MRISLMQFVTDRTPPPQSVAVWAEQRGFDGLFVPEKTHVPTSRQTPWPGENRDQEIVEEVITDRDADFVKFVLVAVSARQAAEDAFFANADPSTGEVQES